MAAALALTMTTRQHSTRFDDFCRNLCRIRYRDGQLDGYASRNHYFSEWIRSRVRRSGTGSCNSGYSRNAGYTCNSGHPGPSGCSCKNRRHRKSWRRSWQRRSYHTC